MARPRPNDTLTAFVRQRAGERCEYCQLPQFAHVRRFQVDHVVAVQHHGETTAENLALACLRCNSHKGPNLSGLDPESGELTPLFHPREDNWSGHFRWDGPRVVGLTDVGRTTIDVLTMNHPDYVALRASLIEEGFLPAE